MEHSKDEPSKLYITQASQLRQDNIIWSTNRLSKICWKVYTLPFHCPVSLSSSPRKCLHFPFNTLIASTTSVGGGRAPVDSTETVCMSMEAERSARALGSDQSDSDTCTILDNQYKQAKTISPQSLQNNETNPASHVHAHHNIVMYRML